LGTFYVTVSCTECGVVTAFDKESEANVDFMAAVMGCSHKAELAEAMRIEQAMEVIGGSPWTLWP
jgi:hypothetical protein